jgi:hypothetical protein
MANSPTSKPSPRRNLAMIVVAVGLALVAGVYFIFTAPARSTLSSDQSALVVAQAAELHAHAQYESYRALGTNAGAKIYQTTKSLDALIPQACGSVATPGCLNTFDFGLSTLQGAITGAGLATPTIGTCTPTVDQTAAYCSYTVSTEGTFSQMVAMVRAFTQLTPLTTVASVETTAGSSGKMTISMRVNVWYSTNSSYPPITASSSTASASTNSVG